jgi:hypothetical protein
MIAFKRFNYYPGGDGKCFFAFSISPTHLPTVSSPVGEIGPMWSRTRSKSLREEMGERMHCNIFIVEIYKYFHIRNVCHVRK